MNLHLAARALVRSVNPDIEVAFLQNTAYTTNAAGKRVATLANPVAILAQVQPVGGTELARLKGMNIQGVIRKVFLYGAATGVIRRDGNGGDVMQFAQAGISNGALCTWFVTDVSEIWPDWSSVIVVLQTT
jgi:hypothetical protein